MRTNSRLETIRNYEAASRGELEIHIWRGNISRWMFAVAVEPGTEVNPDPGLDENFVKDTGMHYDGAMPLQEVESRLNQLSSFQE